MRTPPFLALILALSFPLAQGASPTVTEVTPPPGTVNSLAEITVTFSEEVSGVDASDLSLNGTPAADVTQDGNSYTFAFGSFPLGQAVVSWNSLHGITDNEDPPNPFHESVPGEIRNYQVVDSQGPSIVFRSPVPEVQLRSLEEVELTFSEPVLGVDAADLLANGTPAHAVAGEGSGPYRFSFTGIGNGQATMSLANGHGITDSAANALAEDSWTYTVTPGANSHRILINEFVASNRSGLRDENSDYSDWIELHNAGNTTVNLAGWSLSDDPDDPGKFVLPDRNLLPGNYLVIFATGRDLTPNSPGKIHTNFKLARSGEYLGIFSPELPRQAVDEIVPDYPDQRNDFSYGRDNAGDWTYYSSPTPGRANGNSILRGLLDPPHVNANRGFYNQPFSLQLTSPDPDATIRYTTDGSEPTATFGRVYRSPIRMSSTRIIRAACFRTGYLPSETITHTYIYNANSAVRSLPVLSLVTNNSNLWGRTGIQEVNPRNTTNRGIAWERPCSAELIKTDNSGMQVNCGLRVQGGNYVRGRYNPSGGLPFSKYSFRLYFRGDYGPTMLEYPFFKGSEVNTFDRITLRAGMNDHSNPFIVDEMVRRMSIDTGNVGARGNVVNLFINGQYKGYYNPTERIDDDFMRSWHGGDNAWDVIAQFGEIREGDSIRWNRMRSAVSRDQSNPINYRRTLEMLDVDNFIDYLLVNHYCGVGDWPHNNWRAACERVPGGLFRFYVWDAEWALGNLGRSVGGNTLSGELGGNSEIAQMYRSLTRSPEFRLRWADRVHKHFFNGGALEDERHYESYDKLRSEMSVVLPSLSSSIRNSWIPQRRNIIFQQMRSANLYRSDTTPTIRPTSGVITPETLIIIGSQQGRRARIFYTTDGTDPRINLLTEGDGQLVDSPSRSASVYVAPITLDRSTTLKIRSLFGNQWSALVEVNYSMEPEHPALRFSEIMYNPPGGGTYEFIEMENTGGRSVDLSHMSFEGISFTFAPGSSLGPGERLVLASNDDPNSFAQRYPDAEIAGTFGGSLSNGGERLALVDGAGNTILSVDYDDRNGWPTGADGGGSSLVLRDPAGDLNDPANWLPSVNPNGSPGSEEPARIQPAATFSEVLALAQEGETPAFIELHNPGLDTRNLAGWGLSNDPDFPHKYTFPQGTGIDGGHRLVIWCAPGQPGLFSGFSLNPEGDSLYLTDANGNRVDAFSLGLQVPDLSVSLLDDRWQLTTPSAGEPNGGPVTLALQSELRINEWLSNRIPGRRDWLELYNRDSSNPVALRGLHLRSDDTTYRYGALSFLPPRGFARLWADEKPGPSHLDFRLPAEGGSLALIDQNGIEFENFSYPAQNEDSSSGRIPNGSTSIRTFPRSASPGAANYLFSQGSIRLNELQAQTSDPSDSWIEIYNTSDSEALLTGYSVVIGDREGPRWQFPDGLAIGPRSHLLVPCDPLLSPSDDPGALNTGRALPPQGGSLYLFDDDGHEADRLIYGAQVPEKTIGRTLDTGSWILLADPTPGASNSGPVSLGNQSSLRINEWLANSAPGEDDYVELFNASSTSYLDLGRLRLTDDLSTAGSRLHVFPDLTYLAPQGFLLLIADGTTRPGHLPFSLDARGETLRLLRSTGTVVLNEVTWGLEEDDISSGRVVDGEFTIRQLAFQSPGTSNQSDPAADSDGDEMTDAWETAHGLNPNLDDAALDLDGDHRSNLYEYRSNTDPNDPTSFLTIAATGHADNEFTLQFVARPGVHYLVEYSDDLVTWEQVAAINAAAHTRMESFEDDRDRSGYYRLIASRPGAP